MRGFKVAGDCALMLEVTRESEKTVAAINRVIGSLTLMRVLEVGVCDIN